MTDFILWWQGADLAAKSTVIAAGVAILALIWTVFTYLWPRGSKAESNKVTAKNNSIAAGEDMKGNTILISATSDKD